MITSWSVSNFKSIREQAKLDFGPLTLFVGQNSAGKSTLIQSILLAAQTIQSNVIARSVVLNGRIVRLGSFTDIHANSSSDNSVEIGFDLINSPYPVSSLNVSARSRYYYSGEYQQRMKLVCCSFSFSAGDSDSNDKDLQLQPRLESGSVSYQSADGEANSAFDFKRTKESPDHVLRRLKVSPESVRIPDLTALEFRVTKTDSPLKTYSRSFKLPAEIFPAGVLLRHFLPVNEVAAYDAVSEEVDNLYELLNESHTTYRARATSATGLSSLLGNADIKRIFIEACTSVIENASSFVKTRVMHQLSVLNEQFSLENIERLHAVLGGEARKNLAIQLNGREFEVKNRLRAGRPPRMEIAAFPIPDQIAYATDYVTSFFSERVKYLGPLRDEPKAIYPMAGYNDPKDIGFRGEFTAAVLDNNKTSHVVYVPSASFPFSTKANNSPVNCTLVHAVRDWLEYLGIASAVATEDKGKLGHELTIATSQVDQLHDLTHVGVGVSQALPIVVLSLLAEPGSTLIFEQPELHLNPRVQTRLADFFMSLTLLGKQCIVETHSEYLISRLRYLSAMANDVSISQNIKIYFVEKPSDQSTYNEVQITESGVIKNWPHGFFDETERNSEAIVQAQIERTRKLPRNPKKG